MVVRSYSGRVARLSAVGYPTDLVISYWDNPISLHQQSSQRYKLEMEGNSPPFSSAHDGSHRGAKGQIGEQRRSSGLARVSQFNPFAPTSLAPGRFQTCRPVLSFP